MEIALFASSWVAVGAVLLAWHLDQKRHDQQVCEILDRISTEPRLEMRPTTDAPKLDPEARRYIADHEADDAAWNDYRGEPQEDDTEWPS